MKIWNRPAGIMAAVLLCSPVCVYGGAAVTPESLINRIGPGTVRISLEEPAFEPEKSLIPGESISKDPCVKNTGDVDVYAFLEVTVPAGSIRVIQQGFAAPAARTDFFTFRPDAGWQLLKEETSENASVYVYGCSRRLSPGEKSAPLFSELKAVPYLEGSFTDGEKLSVEIRAKAVACEGLSGDLQEAYTACLDGLKK